MTKNKKTALNSTLKEGKEKHETKSTEADNDYESKENSDDGYKDDTEKPEH